MERSTADCDVVVIGSGYGGAIAADALAGSRHGGREVSLCMLERGNEYLPGSFPSRMADLPRHTRFSTEAATQARGEGSGLFDFRIGSAVSSGRWTGTTTACAGSSARTTIRSSATAGFYFIR